MLASHDISARHPVISQNGSRVAYSTDAGDYIIDASGGAPDKVCGEECAFFWDWSMDESFLLLTSRPSATRQIDLLDLRTRRRAPFLVNDKHGLFQSRLSPDQRWVTFLGGTKYSIGEIFIAPVRNRTAAEEEHWIRVSPPNIWSDKPRWSPDANSVYMLSEQDGFRCLYAQRLDPATKRPVGPLIGVDHFHSARLSMGNIGYGQLEIGVAADKLVFNVGERTGNVWTLTK
jgi:Tol biopolymer transport system component